MSDYGSSDKAGVTFTKPAPRLAKLDRRDFADAIEWVSGFVLRTAGRDIQDVMFDPYAERWHFYEPDGALIVILPHETVYRAQWLLSQ